MKSRRTYFIAAVASQIVVLICLAIPPALTLATGRTISVVTVPVDPWDMFRGDYVRMAYEFSRVPTDEKIKAHTKVFVVLKEDANKKWLPKSIQIEKPRVAQDEIFVAGETESNPVSSERGVVQIPVKYGIEAVYVPEGKGKDLKNTDQMNVVLSIGNDGRAVIKRAEAKGRLLYEMK
jgi:uncharacterized membrane-anchored protein